MKIINFSQNVLSVKKMFSTKGKVFIKPTIVNDIIYSVVQDKNTIFILLYSMRLNKLLLSVDNAEAFDRVHNSPVHIPFPVGKRNIGKAKQLIGKLRSKKGMIESMANDWSAPRYTVKEFNKFCSEHEKHKRFVIQRNS